MAGKCGRKVTTTEELHVLIVDDDVDFAESLVDLLRPRGCLLAVAHSVAEARERITDFDAQVALLDIRLGEESGTDLAKELAKTHPDILCVMMTAYAELDTAIGTIEAGAYDYLRKPLHPPLLYATLGRCAERIRLQFEKVEMQEALRASEQRYRNVFDTAPLALILWDLECGVRDWNEHAETVFGWSREEALGRNFFEFLIPKGALPQVEEVVGNLRRGKVQPAVVNENTTKSGAIVLCQWEHSILRDGNDRVVGVMSLGLDITERRRAEAERRTLIAETATKNAELERFTYTVSHDLKSPLITIRGFLGRLQEDIGVGDAEAIARDVEFISSAADKMYRLLDELLELSRIGHVPNAPGNVALADLMRETVELSEARIAERNVEVKIVPGMPVVCGDRVRLLEVTQNLLDNALKFLGDQKHPCIEIGARQEGNDKVCYVRDNGIGIDPRHHKRIFGLFSRLDPTKEGTGVGLAITKRIIDLHGGKIWAESDGPGRGSTFCFTVPDLNKGVISEHTEG